MSKKRIVVLTGAGISKESGIATFRGGDGLWEGHRIEDVASPQGWVNDREMVLNFYNIRRRQIGSVQPNNGHLGLKELEQYFDVNIITQNIDDLHERAGSSNILHLHGEITKARSTVNPSLLYDIGYDDINVGDKCAQDSQLRPHIVWFGEAVPMLDPAIKICGQADILVIIGTSLVVYPAASLVQYVPQGTPIYIIDPNIPQVYLPNLTKIEKGASKGVEELNQLLIKQLDV